MYETVRMNPDNIGVDDARSAIACILKYINDTNKQVNPRTYPGVEVYENRHLLISYSDSVNALLEWINSHEVKTQLRVR